MSTLITDRLLTPREAAEVLRVTPQTIRSWVRNGTLEGFITGRVCRVKESSVLALLEVR